MRTITISDTPLTLGDLREVWEGPVQLAVDDSARTLIKKSQATVDAVVSGGQQVYGINTGFGLLATVRISDDELVHLQENLVCSHAAGVGDALPDGVVRMIMIMKAKALAQGFSGVRPALVDALCALVNNDILPVIPAQGSVGASGDLAPLAHMSCALLGDGRTRVNGVELPAADALQKAGLKRVRLAPKEGLALLNGTQVSTALALAAAFRTEHILAAVLTAGAMSTDAIKGSDTPFDERIQQVRGHDGQAAVAQALRGLLEGSDIRASHIDCDRVQDPYSIRCQPQVVGACLTVLRHVCDVLQSEANAVTDNPLVFAETDDVLSGGNFHAEAVAFAADYLAISIAEIGSMSERRIALLTDPHLSGLPPFLVEESGLNSGFMMPQIVANQEDHVSMATFAANRLHTMLDNVGRIVAIELLAAAQGIEFHHPKQSSPMLERAVEQIRGVSPRYEKDRSLAPDIEELAALVNSGSFCESGNSILPSHTA
jgi:histidine ammonia-lyase